MTKKNDLISIIVPIYNGADYLSECIESLINQSYKNLEIILIDDASCDNTLEICRKYQAMDGRIKVIANTKNQQQGYCRNLGIKLAQGKYIGFADCDDAADSKQFKTLHKIITKHNADIAICSFYINKKTTKPHRGKLKKLTSKTAIYQFLTNKKFGAFSWNKLFDADFLKKIPGYPEGVQYEDVLFIPQTLLAAQKIMLTNEALYFYRQRPDSVTGSTFFPWKIDIIKAYEKLNALILKPFPEFCDLMTEKTFFAIAGVYNSLILSKYPDKNPYETALYNQLKVYWAKIHWLKMHDKIRGAFFSIIIISPPFYSFILKFIKKFRKK